MSHNSGLFVLTNPLELINFRSLYVIFWIKLKLKKRCGVQAPQKPLIGTADAFRDHTCSSLGSWTKHFWHLKKLMQKQFTMNQIPFSLFVFKLNKTFSVIKVQKTERLFWRRCVHVSLWFPVTFMQLQLSDTNCWFRPLRGVGFNNTAGPNITFTFLV